SGRRRTAASHRAATISRDYGLDAVVLDEAPQRAAITTRPRIRDGGSEPSLRPRDAAGVQRRTLSRRLRVAAQLALREGPRRVPLRRLAAAGQRVPQRARNSALATVRAVLAGRLVAGAGADLREGRCELSSHADRPEESFVAATFAWQRRRPASSLPMVFSFA